jgi:hypothetical protein
MKVHSLLKLCGESCQKKGIQKAHKRFSVLSVFPFFLLRLEYTRRDSNAGPSAPEADALSS